MGLGVSKTGVPDFVRNCGYGRLTITHLDSLWHIGRCPKALIANNFGASSPGYEPGGREFESLRARQFRPVNHAVACLAAFDANVSVVELPMSYLGS